MDLMVALPLHDGASNTLVGFRFVAARKLVEETGVSTTDLDFTTVVEFEFQDRLFVTVDDGLS
jgi:hypothetical protein